MVAGSTPSGFPVTAGALQTALPAPSVATIYPGGGVRGKAGQYGNLVFATFFGDNGISGQNNVASVAIDSAGNIWLTGESTTAALPISPAVVLGPGYVASLSADGAGVSTLITAPLGAAGRGIAVDQSGGIVVLGSRGSFLVPAAEGVPSIIAASNFAGGGVSGTVSSVEIVSLYGYGLGPAIPIPAQVADGIVGSSLGGYQVLFDGIPAPLLSVGSNRIDCIVPEAIPSPAVLVELVTPQGVFSWGSLVWSRFQPQIVEQANGYALALNQDGSVNSPNNPATANSIVTVWATGIAPVQNLKRVDGVIVAPDQLAPTDLQVSIVQQVVSGPVPLEVLYAGDAPNQVWGVSQIDFRLPASSRTTLGYISVTLQIGTSSSSATGIYFHP